MSRSLKYHKFSFCCGFSNKEDKILCNRRFRRICKNLSRSNKEPLHKLSEVSDVYDFDKDGLASYDKDISKKDLRK